MIYLAPSTYPPFANPRQLERLALLSRNSSLAAVSARDQRSDTESADTVISVRLGHTQLRMANSTEDRKSEYKDSRAADALNDDFVLA